LKIGSRAIVIDKESEFYGLTVVITDVRVEPNPKPHSVFKVKTEDGLPPESFPFSSIALRAEQLSAIPVRRTRTSDNTELKDFLLFTMVKADCKDWEEESYEYVQVEKLLSTTKDKIAEYIVKQDISHLTKYNGRLEYFDNPVKYEVLELDRQAECLNDLVMRLFEVEKDKHDEKRAIELEEKIKKGKRDDKSEMTQHEQMKLERIEKMTNLSQTVRKRLKTLAAEKGSNQKEIARELGIKPPSLSNSFDGLDINYDKLLRFADYFDVSIDCLVGLDDDVQAKDQDERFMDLLKERDRKIEELEDRIKDIKHAIDRILT